MRTVAYLLSSVLAFYFLGNVVLVGWIAVTGSPSPETFEVLKILFFGCGFAAISSIYSAVYFNPSSPRNRR